MKHEDYEIVNTREDDMWIPSKSAVRDAERSLFYQEQKKERSKGLSKQLKSKRSFKGGW